MWVPQECNKWRKGFNRHSKDSRPRAVSSSPRLKPEGQAANNMSMDTVILPRGLEGRHRPHTVLCRVPEGTDLPERSCTHLVPQFSHLVPWFSHLVPWFLWLTPRDAPGRPGSGGQWACVCGSQGTGTNRGTALGPGQAATRAQSRPCRL